MSAILETRNVTKRFGELAAVNNLSFEVEKGEIFGIAGPNGAGKTTLFNLISGEYTGEGEILFENQSINGLRPFQVCHRGLARTFQITTVFSTLTVYDNIRVGAHFGNSGKTSDEHLIYEVIDFVGLTGKQDTSATHLSLYDKKLTMLAAALATHPRLLLLDEPIGGLSPVEIKKSVELFRRINSELGITLVIIEHLMKVLTDISQRLMILHNGQKISVGVPADVARDKQVIEVYLGAEYA
jgi:branched-chain amino acid transport system ATP-binding protein